MAESTYIRNPDVILREEEAEGGLLFNPDTDHIKVVNSSGLMIWKLCDGTRDIPAMASALKEHFDTSPEDTVDEDILKFIQEMEVAGFIGVLEERKN